MRARLMKLGAYEPCQIKANGLREQAVLDGPDARVERLRRVAALDGHGLLEDDRPAVRSLIDEVDGYACFRHTRGESLADRVQPGEGGEERGVDVDRRKTPEEGGRQKLHVAGADDDLDAFLLEPIGHGQIAFLARGELLQREDRGRHACAGPSLEGLDALLIRRDRRDGEPFVEQRLQVRSGSGDEDPDHTSLPIAAPAPASLAGTTAHMPTPRLKTRRCSSSATPRPESQSNTGGRSQLSQSISASTPAGSARGRFPMIPPPVTCASALTSARALSSRTSST